MKPARRRLSCLHGRRHAPSKNGPRPARSEWQTVHAAVHIEEKPEPRSAAAKLGSMGSKARAASLSKEKRGAIAKKAAGARWSKG
jgi:hypothetical protein